MNYIIGIYVAIGLVYYISCYKEILEASKDSEILPTILFSVWLISSWPMFMYSVHKGREEERSKRREVENDDK